MAHVCMGGQGRQSAWAQEFETSLGNMTKPCLYKKTLKRSYEWWPTSTVPATQEAEVEGSPEPQEAEAAGSCDHTTALQSGQQSETLSPKKRKKEKY